MVTVGIAAVTALSILGLSHAFAPATSACEVYVSGYYRSNGTYVSGHYRTCANSTPWDNWSTTPNTNPYTGERGYRDPFYDSYRAPSYRSPSSTSSSTCFFWWSC